MTRSGDRSSNRSGGAAGSRGDAAQILGEDPNAPQIARPLWAPGDLKFLPSIEDGAAPDVDPGYLPTDPPDFEQEPRPSLRTRCVTPTLGLSERPVVPLEKDRAVLVSLDGPMSGRLHSLSLPRISVGRSTNATITVDDVGVSRQHANMSIADGAWYVEDLGSKNGTYLDGRVVGRATMSDGNVLRFGPAASFRFQLMDEREEAALRRLYETSHHDSLTGMYNRRYLDVCLSMELAFATRHNTKLSLVLLDVDHFKRLNDTYGHAAGDEALKHVAVTIRRQLRAEDVFARYGGEEFAILLREVGAIEATIAAERVRRCIEGAPLRWDGRTVSVTLSAGCAALDDCETMTAKGLVGLADRRLYEAKKAGRNRVVAVG